MKRRRILCLSYCLLLAALAPVGATDLASASPTYPSTDEAVDQTQQRPRTSRTPQPNVSNELRRINGRLAALKSENDSLRARITRLERGIRDITAVVPELRASLESAVKAKTSMDSSELALVNQLSLMMNKIRLLEDKASYIDSTNFEILSQLVLIENKIVSLTSSFNDIMAARQAESSSPATSLTDEEFRRSYIEALTAYQNGQYAQASDLFVELVKTGGQHELTDNSQYWLAECFYARKNFKRAISEFERIFNYPASDKADDARYKIGLSYWNAGSHDRARIEFQRLLDEFPNSDLGEKARRYLQ